VYTRTIRAALPALLFAAAVVPAVAASLGAQSPERHTLAGSRVSIWNIAGRAIVEPTSGREVIVEVRRGGRDGRELTISSSNERLVVQYPERDIVYRDGPSRNYETRLSVNSDGTFASDNDWSGRTVRVRSSGGGFEGHADLRIQVPRGQRLQLNLGVGAIEATNVDGEIELRTRASPVTTRETKGVLIARTGSGRVTIERAEGEVTASTGSGSVELVAVRGRDVRASTGSGTISGRDVTAERFDASTGSGGVRIDDLATESLRASAGSGSVRLALIKMPRESVARTGSGSVDLALPDDASAELDISTGSGGISTEFPVTMDNVQRRALRGRIGNGDGNSVRVSTGSGGVRLRKR
jgi:lia operon protein LiaG